MKENNFKVMMQSFISIAFIFSVMISISWINSPSEFTFKFEMDNNTRIVTENIENISKLDRFYSDEFECDLMLEQSVSCFQGCHFFAEKSSDYNIHELCIDYCDNRYYVEFDNKGDVSYCEYSKNN